MTKTGLVGVGFGGVDEGRDIGREKNKNDSWERRTQEKINTKHDTNWLAERDQRKRGWTRRCVFTTDYVYVHVAHGIMYRAVNS